MQSDNKINFKQVFHLYETDQNDDMLQAQEIQVLSPHEKDDDSIMSLLSKYLNDNPEMGYLKFQATTDRGMIPVENVGTVKSFSQISI